MKTAVLVGATGGIASQLKSALEVNGYKVISVSRTEGIVCDLTDEKQINEALKKVKQEAKKIDLLVNASGVATYKNITNVLNKEMIDAYMVNAISPAIFIRELASLMSHEGTLVLSIGSGAGTIPMKGRSIYCATKYAMRGLSLSLSEEYKEKYPEFCHITLGSTLTDFGPLSLEEKQKQADGGKAYFPVKFVVEKLMEIIKSPKRESEVVLFPGDHGFGVWEKPQ